MSASTVPNGHTARPVRVLSVPFEGVCIVRLLGPIRGLMQHYGKSGPTLCPGKGCRSPQHARSGAQWKGYCAADSFDPESSFWVSVVLEVTEALEELLHGRNLRGECWSLQREARPKNKNTVVGVFLDRCDLADLRPTFDISPVLCRIYHEAELPAHVPNPIPHRLFMDPVYAPAPVSLVPILEAPPPQSDPAERKKMEEQLAILHQMVLKKKQQQQQRSQENGQNGGAS